MEYLFAPMEGLTDMVYRRTHQKYFPGIDRYYTPFVSPTQNHLFSPREIRELCPENNAGVPLVPQLLGKNAEDMLWAIQKLADWGYEEVNLNMGCPSNTVTAKGKGSGLLAKPKQLDAFLSEVFAKTPVQLSVKTRLGFSDPSEFEEILRIYNQYPISKLIIHPRTKAQMYQGNVYRDVFAAVLEKTQLPICYNGDLFTPADCLSFEKQFPSVSAVMLGRGLVANPAMVSRLSGGCLDKTVLRHFHENLCSTYVIVFGSEPNTMRRMKAIWGYMLPLFSGGEAYRKRLVKTKSWADFNAIIDDIFQRLSLSPNENSECTG